MRRAMRNSTRGTTGRLERDDARAGGRVDGGPVA
jgi:hypothetical protein